MKHVCAGCGLTLPERYLRDGLCVGCAFTDEPVHPVHRVHREHHCAACGHPALGDLCAPCDDFVST